MGKWCLGVLSQGSSLQHVSRVPRTSLLQKKKKKNTDMEGTMVVCGDLNRDRTFRLLYWNFDSQLVKVFRKD